MERYKFYKSKEIVGGRNARKEEIKNKRKDQRQQMLEQLRHMESAAPENPPIVVTKQKKSRLELLKEWKQEKAQKENQEKQIKKPPFYVGKLHTKATGSPLLTNTATKNRLGATTRSQSRANNTTLLKPLETTRKKNEPKRLKLHQLNRVEKNVLKPVENHSFELPKAVAALHKLTIPQSPKITKSARKSVKPLMESLQKDIERASLNPILQAVAEEPKAKRRILIPKAETVEKSKEQEEAMQVEEAPQTTENKERCLTKKTEKMEYTPDNSQHPLDNFGHLDYSPFIQKRRGSGSMSLKRSSKKKSMTLTEKIDAEIEKEEMKLHSQIASFRLFLSNETKRLLDLSETWLKRIPDENVPSDVEGDINAVAGKTRLLTSDKFKQFAGLIDKCEAGDPKIKIDDLRGFHDWVSLEVEDLDKQFFNLEERRKNNWVAIPDLKQQQFKKVLKRKPVANAAVKRNVPSSMRAHIMAARKQRQADQEELPVVVPEKPSTPPVTPRRSIPPGTPRDRSDLRIHVLTRCSGLAMLAATSSARASLSPAKSSNVEPTAEPMETDPIVNFTPARSILKKTPVLLSEKKTVAFSSKLDPKYLLPAEDSSDESPILLALVDEEEVMSPMTPRRSTRLARKSAA